MMRGVDCQGDEPTPRVRFQLALTLGASASAERLHPLAALLRKPDTDTWTQTAVFSSCGKQAATLLVSLIAEAQKTGDLPAKQLGTAATVASLAVAPTGQAKFALLLSRLSTVHRPPAPPSHL